MTNQTHSAQETAAATSPAFVPKVLKQVSTNLLKLRTGSSIYIRITGKMEVAKALKRQKDGDDKKEPPTLIPVVNLETGEVQSVIAGSVLKDLMNDEYPKDSYVGRCFWIVVKDQKSSQGGGGRRYNTYDVKEIADPAKS